MLILAFNTRPDKKLGIATEFFEEISLTQVFVIEFCTSNILKSSIPIENSLNFWSQTLLARFLLSTNTYEIPISDLK